MRAVILAGGQGRRLRPYTTVLPKPLMPVSGRPILETIIGRLREAGVTEVTIAVGYLAALIQSYFGDGERFGVRIDYSLETEPLGTAGPLSLIERPEADFFVMNGDILTDIDLVRFMGAHRERRCIATLATYEKLVPISLGVLELSADANVVGYTEKPTLRYPVSTGMYCFKPSILDHIPRGRYLDLPDLVKALLARGEAIAAHAFDGLWLDIGRPEDYAKAEEMAESQG